MKGEVIKLITVIAGAGGIGSWLTFKLGNRKQDISEFSSIILEYKSLLDGFKKEVIDLRNEVEELKGILIGKHEEVTELRGELKIIKKVQDANNS